ncbi:MAG: LytR C-terminal domain-containing protein [Patescibacteria group bacterium]
MTLIYLRKFSFVFLFSVFLALQAPKVLAQDAVSLSVSPTIFEMTANPGQTWESNVRVININSFPLRVYADVVNFRPLDERGTSEFIPVIKDEADKTTFAEWITVPDGEIIVPAEQTLQIPLTVTVPVDAAPGSHFAAVLIGTEPPVTAKEDTSVETAQIVTSLLFLRVTGDIVEDGDIRSFRATKGVVNTPEATLELRFENKGNVHLQPQGEIKIFNMWGQERGVIPVNQHTLFGNVLPTSVRNYSFTWTGEWSPADIGRYRAVATLAYGTENRQFANSATAFWLIPWKILIGTLLTIVAMVLIFTQLIKMYVRRMLLLAGVSPDTQVHSSSTPALHARRKISVVAPLEAGILDLRAELRAKGSTLGAAPIIIKFLRANTLFFIAILLVVGTVAAIAWYFANALTEKKSFEVTAFDAGPEMTLNSDELEYQALAATSSKNETPAENLTPITIVNRSGINGAAAEARVLLEREGYTVDKLETDLGVIERRSVIVYTKEHADTALELSTLLGNALLSSYAPAAADEDETTAITIYVGTDVARP